MRYMTKFLITVSIGIIAIGLLAFEIVPFYVCYPIMLASGFFAGKFLAMAVNYK